ncbi:hypothetical protein [Faecalibacter rhinopitheci]|uniref:Uncharacterized protein n=1 Tax=Faecalibacter rhinopitheci TaxID=2779678 RepID=A0A8J7FQG6_9FLAO|nr:hypothetical protein [Faecalibacter rhinopitheci]MBF0596368.1 hypothetical protein [Faecalibacter rhinopitheci]
MKLLAALLSFLFISCGTKSRYTSTPILRKLNYINQFDSLGNIIGKERKWITETQKLPYGIELITKNKSSIYYKLQGNYHSSGLNATTLKNISTALSTENDTLKIKHIVTTKNGFGKEGNNIVGYNFTKTNSVKIPKNIKAIQIEMEEYNSVNRIVNRNPFDSANSKYAHLTIEL